MMKKIFVLILLLTWASYAQAGMVVGSGAAAACTDHQIDLSSASSAEAISTSVAMGSKITIANTGTIKSIGVYVTVDNSSGGTLTLRWKKNSGDLSSGYIDSITSPPVTGDSGIYVFDVSDTAFTAGDYLYWGVIQSDAGFLRLQREWDGSAAEIGVNAASGWNMNDETSTAHYDWYSNYVNCY